MSEQLPRGWKESAGTWIKMMGERGDFARQHILDPEMLARVELGSFATALDVGCGEGRFCRLLKARGINTVGLDPTSALIAHAKSMDSTGIYIGGRAERLPFNEGAFDLVVSYLSLVDIPGLEDAISEMSRVVAPGGSLLIANLTSFNSAGLETGWIEDAEGRIQHYPVDRYLEDRSAFVSFRYFELEAWHRPLSRYMSLLIDSGLQLRYFSEPSPRGGAPDRVARYLRAPWFLVMEWRKLPWSVGCVG